MLSIHWVDTTEVEGSEATYDIWKLSVYRNSDTGHSYWVITDKWERYKLFGNAPLTLDECKVRCAEEVEILMTTFPLIPPANTNSN